MPKKQKSTADVLEETRALMGMSKVEFYTALEMSRQNYNNLLKRGQEMDVVGLQESAVENIGTWIGDLAVKLLIVRGAMVPCVCQTEMGDAGPCPKHGNFTKKEKAKRLVDSVRAIYQTQEVSA